MGYSAPSPGDEVEIPRDVCRPLRILGDLYFKSERPGEVELAGVSKVTKQSVESLTTEQQDLLWSYIESHPQFTGKSRKLLPGGRGGSSSEGEAGHSKKPRKESSGSSYSGSQTPGIIPSRHVHIGRISRFSNAGNAMFEPKEGRELNLGSLPRSAEGKTTIGAQYASSFALCLTPQLWTSSYRKTVRENLDELVARTGLSGLNRLLRIRDRDSPQELSESDVPVFLSILGTGYGIGFRGPWTIVVLSDHLSGHRELRVEIVDDYDEILVARPIPLGENSEPVSVGSEIEIFIDQIGDDVIRGTYGPRLVDIKRTSSSPRQTVRAAITEIDAEHIVASVSALDESSRPVPGELVTIEEGELTEYPGIPVMTPSTLPDSEVPLSLIVDSVETDGVRVSVSKMSEAGSFSVGQELSVRVTTWSQGIGTAIVEGVPLRIEGGRPIPTIPIRITITGFSEGYVRSRFIEADVEVVGDADVGSLLDTGDQLLQAGKYTEAMTSFVNAVELVHRGNSSEYGPARLREILAICEHLGNENDVSSGVSFLESIDAESEALNESIQSQLNAYRRVLEADKLITEAESADGITATTNRRDAKEILEDAVDHLTTIEDVGSPPPHPVVVAKLAHTADRLILTPDTVSRYLDTVSEK